MTWSSLFSFYRSKEWEKLRRALSLERVGADGELICEHCHKPIVKQYDAICHHKIQLTEANVNDVSISLNPENIAIVHQRCHNQIHDRFGSYTRHIYIVWGAPCSGKTSYVYGNAGRHDLIVDVDSLYKAVSINPLHDKSNRLTANVLQLRATLLDQIRTRNGKWVNAWVIISKCRPAELNNMASSLGAELIHIDTDKDTCLLRAKEREYGNSAEYIEEYFRDYEAYRKLLDSL